MLDAGKNALMPQAPDGPHAGMKWAEIQKRLDNAPAKDLEETITLPLGLCVNAMVPDGLQNGAFKTMVISYGKERKKRLDDAKPKSTKSKPSKTKGNEVLASADDDE